MSDVMGATEAQIGYGTKYEIEDAAGSGTFFEVGEVTEVTPGEEAADQVEATHMQSPGRRRERIAGLIDPGEASFGINWIPGNETDQFLRGLLKSGERRLHKQTYPNGVSVTYTGAITGYSKAVPLDDRMTATITVAISGEDVWEGDEVLA